MTRLALAWWLGVPSQVARVSTLLATTLADGCFVIRWPVLALLLPVVAFGLGALFGSRHFGDSAIATYSLLALIVGAALGVFGGAPGFWFTVGFAIFDFILWPHRAPLERPALPIVYVLLLLLAAAIPVVGKI